MKRLSLICLLFALFGCESIFFEQYKIINPKIYKKDLSYYKVIKGDSLWGIGMKFDKKNIEEFLVETKKLNNLVNSEIFEDQILIIP